MSFKKLSYYIYHANVTITCDHIPLCNFLMAHTLNLNINCLGTEIVSMSFVIFIFKHIKGTDNILADSILHQKSLHLYESLDPEWEGKEFRHVLMKDLPP